MGKAVGFTGQFYKKRKVLLVDDCEPIRTAIKGMLQTLGFVQIQTASNGARALQLCLGNKFDVILCDFNLGKGKDGYQLFEEVKQKKLAAPGCLFFILSAEARRQLVHGIVELQPDDYLMKPFTYKALGSRLERAYFKRQALNPIYQSIDSNDYELALACCKQVLAEKPEYLVPVLRLQGELLIKCERYKEATVLYTQVLAKREFPWAWLGIAICKLKIGQTSKARAMFEELSEKAEVRVEALDWLGRLFLECDHLELAKEAFIEASKISPRNIERQRAIAHLTMACGELEVAVRAHKKIVEGIRFSVHETPEHHLNYARCLLDLAVTSNDLISVKCVNRALEVLRDASRRYGLDAMASQDQVVKARISALRGNLEEARFLLYDAEHMPKLVETIEDRLDKAKAFFVAGEPERATAIMESLETIDTKDNLSRVTLDAVVKKEREQQGKFMGQVRTLNNEGMELYKMGAFGEALDCFLQAFEKMPNSASLALNLAQALTKAWGSKLTRQRVLSLCKQCIMVIEANPLSEHNQQRYDVIRRELDSMLESA